MDTTKRGIILLLKSAVTQSVQTMPQDFNLEAAYPLIKRHHITSMAYIGASYLGFDNKLPVMNRLFEDYCKTMLISKRQMAQINRLYCMFDENHIDYMPLKGCNMKGRYPQPELRAMGDADILIRMEQYGIIRELLEKMGFKEKTHTDHELIWHNNSLLLELHKRLIPSYNKDLYAHFGDGWDLAVVNEGSRYVMTVEDEWIYLFTHFAKHYRDGGIGCRHVVDLWVYLRTYPNMDQQYVKEQLEKLRLTDFYHHTLRLIDLWFRDGSGDDVTEYMSEFILASGSWGQMESKALSRAVRDAKHSALGFNGKLLYLWQTAFPRVEVLRDKYTFLKKAPWLLPAVWVIRPFYKILFERRSLKRHEQNLEVLSRNNIELRQQMLNYVGLDYHF